MRRWNADTLAVVFAILPAACTAGGDAGPADAITRDSAGITIVENPASTMETPVGWTIAAAPDVDIGAQQSDSMQQLFRVTGAAVLDDGGIVVSNGGSQQLRFFDGQGVFVRNAGGAGRGPGEFQFPLLVPSLTHDTLYVFDMFASVLSLMTTGGEYVRSIPTAGRGRSFVGHIGGGRFIVSRNTATVSPDSKDAQIENLSVYEVFDPALDANDSIAVLAGPSLYRWVEGARVGFQTVPFTIAPSAAPGRGSLVLLPTSVAELRLRDDTGRLQRIARVLTEAVPVTRAEFDSAVEAGVARERTQADQALTRRLYSAMSPPEARPQFSNVIVDVDGNAWARRFGTDPDGPGRWIVFDERGVVRGWIETPPGLTIHQIGTAFVLGVWRDPDGVEHVRLHRLDRSGR